MATHHQATLLFRCHTAVVLIEGMGDNTMRTRTNVEAENGRQRRRWEGLETPTGGQARFDCDTNRRRRPFDDTLAEHVWSVDRS